MSLRPAFILPLLLLSPAALAQQAGPSAGPEAADEEAIGTQRGDILVVGTRYTGQVDAAQPPLMTLNEADIATYGAGSLTELIAALSPQTGSGRGRGGHPVILLGGQRISNFREMRDFPPEAIKRMEVLPEEVALRFGFPPNQRVINFILKDSFAAWTLDGEYNVSTHGDFAASEGKLSLLQINGPSRLNFNAYIEDGTLLTEGDRGLFQPTVPGDTASALFRSLIAQSRDLGVNGSWSTGLGDRGLGGSLSVNASFARNDTLSLAGLDFGDPLERASRTDRLEGGAALNKRLGDWLATLTVDGGHIVTDSLTDRRVVTAGVAAGQDRARVANDSATSLLTLAGPAFRMPAGEVSATFKAGFAYTGIASDDTRRSGGTARLKRNDASAGFNIAIPLTSRRDNVLAGFGDFSVNFSAGLNHLSDFGTLSDWSAGLTWSPFEKLSLQASYLVNEAAPSLGDLGNPSIVSLNVPTYDFARGENVLIAVTSGGNPVLKSERQRDLKFSVNWELPIANSRFVAEYFRNRSSDVTAAFPLLTPAIEAAFPGRATRNAAGQLIAIDRRPVTFAETSSSRLRYGLNVSGSIGKAAPGQAPGGPMGGPPPGAGRGGPGGGPGMGRGGGMGRMMGMMGGGTGQGRWNLSVYHTLRFSDRVTIATGGQQLDLLGGDSLSGGGVARHGLELEGGMFRKGFGLRLNGKWSAPTTLKANGAPGTSDLRFGSAFKLDVRIFANLGMQKRLTDMSPFFKGMTLAFQFDNIFDSRQKVTDASGATPFSYLPDFLDPRGRMVGIDLRKTF